eukprot:NODE_3506_length_661_cov_227.114379_g2500_i0.p3 GENE.NODE_3506_length_661_cov_227.114379_g2500_i0~~NODE_3506_length_661_cov_227.114379_g2500_i0.p3  ORF type:complete len:124 (-),score=52.63 NODE_3506_length_661_cov_227.114379_g2500_i0:257-628(-)
MGNANYPNGSTNLTAVLEEAFEEHFHTFKKDKKIGTTILVITDGEPDDRGGVERSIVDAANRLKRDSDLSLSFIQIGDDPGAAQFLKYLDDNLRCKFDIVDTLKNEELQGMRFSDVINHSIND